MKHLTDERVFGEWERGRGHLWRWEGFHGEVGGLPGEVGVVTCGGGSGHLWRWEWSPVEVGGVSWGGGWEGLPIISNSLGLAHCLSNLHSILPH